MNRSRACGRYEIKWWLVPTRLSCTLSALMLSYCVFTLTAWSTVLMSAAISLKASVADPSSDLTLGTIIHNKKTQIPNSMRVNPKTLRTESCLVIKRIQDWFLNGEFWTVFICFQASLSTSSPIEFCNTFFKKRSKCSKTIEKHGRCFCRIGTVQDEKLD